VNPPMAKFFKVPGNPPLSRIARALVDALEKEEPGTIRAVALVDGAFVLAPSLGELATALDQLSHYILTAGKL
jgi:hypothetical protein